MSQYNAGGDKGLVASGDLGDAVIVKKSSASQVVVGAAATDALIGVTVGSAKSGDPVSVRLRSAEGTSKVKLGGTVTLGAKVTSNGSGLGVATTTGGNEVVGIALEAGVSGDIIEIMNTTGQVVAGA